MVLKPAQVTEHRVCLGRRFGAPARPMHEKRQGTRQPRRPVLRSRMSHTHEIAIVGVDYSDLCIPAVDKALRVVCPSAGASSGGVLIPLLVLPDEPASAADNLDTDRRAQIARAKVNLVRLVEARARSHGLAPPGIVPRVRFGDPAANILSEARERGAARRLSHEALSC